MSVSKTESAAPEAGDRAVAWFGPHLGPELRDLLTLALGAPVPDAAAAGTAAKGEGAVLVLHDRPARTLARALQAGTAPAKATATWSDRARSLLGLLRRHRAGTVLLEAGDALAAPDAFAALAGRPLPAGAAPPAEPDPVLVLAAEYLIATEPGLRDLTGELDARCRRLGPGGPNAPVSPLDQVAAAIGRHAALARSSDDCASALDAERARLARAEAARAAAEAEIRGLKAERDAAQAEVRALLESTSWRITGPMRVLSRSLHRR